MFCNNRIRKVKSSIKIYKDNILIEQVAETKFLGVIITENLTWITILKLFAMKLAKALE